MCIKKQPDKSLRLISRMQYSLMEVFGDNIQRDEAKRNRAEEEIK